MHHIRPIVYINAFTTVYLPAFNMYTCTMCLFMMLLLIPCDNAFYYTAMVDDSNILMHFGGLDRNSLIRILNPNDEDQSIFYDEPSIMKNSPYYHDEKLINELNTKTNNFNILSLNCESINSKFDQINITIEQFKRNGCTFSAVCLQESWLSDDSDTSLLQLDGYNLISQGKRCSTRGGLIIYLKDTIKYKLIDIEANSNIWEGQFIEIEQENVGNKKIILGNVYRPPRDTNENYNQFINEFDFLTLEKAKVMLLLLEIIT